MNTSAIARDYLRKAKARFHALEVLFQEKSFDDVVREAQEIVELILKGALRHIGVDPPKRHDVGETVKTFADRFPSSWQEGLKRIVGISEQLAEERAHAFYGREEDDLPPSELFTSKDAERALGWAKELLALYEQLLHP